MIPILRLLLSMTSKTSAARPEILLVSGLKPSHLFLVLVIFVEERLSSSSESEVISCRLRFSRDRALRGALGGSFSGGRDGRGSSLEILYGSILDVRIELFVTIESSVLSASF